MAACATAVCAVAQVVVGGLGRCEGRRGPGVAGLGPCCVCGGRGDGSSQAQRPGWGCCASFPSESSVFGRESVLRRNGRGLQSEAGHASVARSSSRSRNVVCDVAVTIGDAQSSEGKGTMKDVKVGAKVRVKVPLTVYHVMKSPNLNIEGLEGEVKDVVTVYKGKPISANLPYKVQFFIDVDGRDVKFFAHLKDDEFDIVE